MLNVFLLGLVQTIVNTWLRIDYGAQHSLQKLYNKRLRIISDSPVLSVDILFDDDKIRIEPTPMGAGGTAPLSVFEQRPFDKATPVYTADTTLHVRHLVDGIGLFNRPITEGGNIPVQGEMAVLQHLQQMLIFADPNIGDLLHPYIGEEAAELIHRTLYTLQTRAKELQQTLQQNTQEWIKEDLDVIAPRYRFNAFKHGVQELTLRLEKLEAQLHQSSNTNSVTNSVENPPFALDFRSTTKQSLPLGSAQNPETTLDQDTSQSPSMSTTQHNV